MLEKFTFSNADGSAIDIPDAESWRQLIAHVQFEYPDIYQRHLGKYNIHDMAQFKSFEETEDYKAQYIEFVKNIKHPIILPNGSELLNPFPIETPVGFDKPKTLHEILHSTLNIGRITDAYEEEQEALYDAEREYAAFEEVGELAKNYPERFKSLFSDSLYSDAITDIITKHNAKDDSGLSSEPEPQLEPSKKDATTGVIPEDS